MPVLEQYSKYIRPAMYDDVLTIKTSIAELPKTRIRFEYEIYNQNNALIHKAYTVLAFVHTQTLKPVPCPDVLLNLLKPFYS
jgi:acyl-CoA thioester hydrolase